LKIATVSDDGTTISQHFGKAQLYVVLTVEDGKIVAKEQRIRGSNTCACGHGQAQGDEHLSGGQQGHSGPESQLKHSSMADAIADCNVVIARGMGYGAYNSLKSRNLNAIITDVADIDQAVKMYIDGKLINYMEQLH
jgi:predicted Fe-Mo cluster-binding NifX family protein